MTKKDVRSLTLKETEDFILSLGEAKFRGKQIYSWINKHMVTSFDEMTNIPKSLKEKLYEKTFISNIEIVEKYISNNDDAIKYLFQLEKTTIIESVLMKYSYGNTVCVSTQAGCKMGCAFCASTIGGLDRNLSAGEIAGQIYKIQKDLGIKVTNVVLMGCGEPFDNYENTIKFIQIINSVDGINIGQRNITVSTCGIVEKIYSFAEAGTQVNLAISLHAPNDDIRGKIMPVGKKYSINSILEACSYYCKKTNRRVTYEYALISGINDSKQCAQELGSKIKATLCHVNLIPINDVSERNFKGSSREKTEEFAKELEKLYIQTSIRRKVGKDIDGACGQLRKKSIREEN